MSGDFGGYFSLPLLRPLDPLTRDYVRQLNSS
jgi:hypothetical protein